MTPGKVSKQNANYRPATGQETCRNCKFFIYASRQCQVVEGPIDQDFTSDLYQPKELGVMGAFRRR